jgi:hypothetical protein
MSDALTRLRQFIPSIKGISDSNRTGLLHLVDLLEREKYEWGATATHALTFYADPQRYKGANCRPFDDDPYTEPGAPYMQDIHRDGGELAKSALKFYARR